MALYVANKAFAWAGIQVRVGDVYEDDSQIFTLFPGNFSVPDAGPLRSSGAAAAGTLGTVVKKLEVFDSLGTSLGYLPIYDAIT